MEPEQVMTLFESIWFENQILHNQPKNPILETTQQTDLKTEASKLPTIHVRSKSDQLSSIKTFSESVSPKLQTKCSDSISPNSVLISPKLQPIRSGKEEFFETVGVIKQRRRSKTEKRSTKSLTDLEFEEIKGFMDLGFVFSEDDVKSNLVEILPGLQRLGKKEDDIERESVSNNEIAIQRPYLSEAWKELGKKEKIINPLVNLKIKDLGKEIDVKQSLKWWAHSVASTVR